MYYPTIRKGLLAGLMSCLVMGAAAAQQARITLLKVGTSPSVLAEKTEEKETSTRESLTKFIKSETGFDNEVTRAAGYEDLAARLDKGELHIGVFSGFEFAWAQQQYPRLRALALAINEYPNRYVHVVTRRDHAARDMAGLGKQVVSVPRSDGGYGRMFINQASRASNRSGEDFFAKVIVADNQEEILDDVVDGVVQAAAVDRVALTAYKRRKPGRFNQLKEVARSPALPPPIVAYREGVLDQATLQRFQSGLLSAADKADGRTLLTLSRLTGFIKPPADLDQQLARSREAFPAPDAKQP